VRLAEERMTPVNEGEILAGKYRVERVLGVGGMGVVVAALHLALDERVAIKFLLPEALTNAEAVARFAREARAAVKIKSQHVARVIDVGTLETGAPYMVMEFLKGQDLSNHLPSTTSSRPAKPSRRHTRSGSFTATSSRRTCS
jgi:serine/threonine protein kinase